MAPSSERMQVEEHNHFDIGSRDLL